MAGSIEKEPSVGLLRRVAGHRRWGRARRRTNSSTVATSGWRARVAVRSTSTSWLASHRHIRVRSGPTNRSNNHTGIGNRLGLRPVTRRQIVRHSESVRTSAASARSEPTYAPGSANARAAMAPRSSADSQGERPLLANQSGHEVPCRNGRIKILVCHQLHEGHGTENSQGHAVAAGIFGDLKLDVPRRDPSAWCTGTGRAVDKMRDPRVGCRVHHVPTLGELAMQMLLKRVRY
jgi:hypothetical protein